MKKFKECPYCKSKKGFSVLYHRRGRIIENKTFAGKNISSEVDPADIISYAECLNCEKTLDHKRLNI